MSTPNKASLIDQWQLLIETAALYKGPIFGRDMGLQINFSNLLKKSLEEYNLTVTQLARKMNKSRQTVHLWVNCSTCPTWKTMMEIKNIFQTLEDSKNEQAE